jgi:hypothetical protein
MGKPAATTRLGQNRQLPAVTLHQAARHQRPAVDQHEEDQLERQRLLQVCFGVHRGLKYDIARSPKSAQKQTSGAATEHDLSNPALAWLILC